MRSKKTKIYFGSLCKEIAKKTGIPQALVCKSGNAILSEIVDHLCADKEVMATGFGVFSAKQVPARTVANGFNSGTLRISPAHKRPRLKFSKTITRRINESF